MKHCSSLANDPDCLRGLHGLVRERLRDLGINMTRPSKAKKTVFPATPGKKTPSMIPKSHVTVVSEMNFRLKIQFFDGKNEKKVS